MHLDTTDTTDYTRATFPRVRISSTRARQVSREESKFEKNPRYKKRAKSRRAKNKERTTTRARQVCPLGCTW